MERTPPTDRTSDTRGHDTDSAASRARGVDAPAERRPGVPMEADRRPIERVPYDSPPRQELDVTRYTRVGLDAPTPVVGTAQPPRGLSGAIRRAAYEIPEHRARHWMLLMAADRVDVLEHRLEEALGGTGLEQAGTRMASGLRQRPLASVLLAGAAGFVLASALRRR